MTPKEKAEELIGKFMMLDTHDEDSFIVRQQRAKRYALIAVDEILNNFGLVIYGKTFYTSSNTVFFYKEVKQEIQNL